MVFDHESGYSIAALKGKPIASDEEALELCFGWLDSTQEKLEHKPHVKVKYFNVLSAESTQLLNTAYVQYISEWKTIHMPGNCELYVVENNVFPYWQPTEREDRDQWIAGERDYLVMQRLRTS